VTCNAARLEVLMPERHAVEKAKAKLRRGRASSTAAGELVREEIRHVRTGKHGARSAKQAIAIGLSKARRAGVPLRPPRTGTKKTRRSAERAYEAGQHPRTARAPSTARRRAVSRALRREPGHAASHRALASQAHRSAARRGPAARASAARKGAVTKGLAGRRAAARKAARTRARRGRPHRG